MRRIAIVLVVAGLVGCVAACTADRSSVPTASASSSAAPTQTVWLCQPGQPNDPCASSDAATVVPASGPRTTQPQSAGGDSPFDCFYVYPTVSTEPSDNADLQIQRTEIDAAIAQASPFSSVCRVWAPMYRQRTLQSLQKGLGGDPNADNVAYQSLLSAWKDYLAHDNQGRPVVFIGHSQGAAMLIRLLSSEVDADSTLLSRMVAAIVAGGNVAVPIGKTVDATFKNIPVCTATGQDGCVIAYSTFPGQPPSDALFGRPGQGVSVQSGQTQTDGVQVACTNPAALSGGTANLDSYFLAAASKPPPPPVTTPWVSYPDLYAGSCQNADGASWLQVDTLTVAGRPLVSQSFGPLWGYHGDDISLTLGNLVADVAASEATYSSHH